MDNTPSLTWFSILSLCICKYIHIFINLCVCMLVCVYICTCVCVCVRANTYRHIYRIYKHFLGPIPSKQISLLKGLANLSGSPHSRNYRSRALFKIIHYCLEVGKHGATLCVHRPAFALILAFYEALISLWNEEIPFYGVREFSSYKQKAHNFYIFFCV